MNNRFLIDLSSLMLMILSLGAWIIDQAPIKQDLKTVIKRKEDINLGCQSCHANFQFEKNSDHFIAQMDRYRTAESVSIKKSLQNEIQKLGSSFFFHNAHTPSSRPPQSHASIPKLRYEHLCLT